MEAKRIRVCAKENRKPEEEEKSKDHLPTAGCGKVLDNMPLVHLSAPTVSKASSTATRAPEPPHSPKLEGKEDSKVVCDSNRVLLAFKMHHSKLQHTTSPTSTSASDPHDTAGLVLHRKPLPDELLPTHPKKAPHLKRQLDNMLP